MNCDAAHINTESLANHGRPNHEDILVLRPNSL